MEKQTMGKFIATLRKANGMTQADLAERLCVSNKSISKWECDDGYPDLMLIPLIAEIFGVTSDEILKGGRIVNSDNSSSEHPKSEKQVNVLLQKALTRFKNLSVVAIALGIVGLTMFCLQPLISSNGGGSNTLFTILTVLSIIFILASVVIEIIVMNNAKTAIFDFGSTEDKRILKVKRILDNWAFNIIVIDSLVFLGSIAPLSNGLTAYSLLLLPSLYVFAYIAKMLLTDKTYYNISEHKQVISKIKKTNLIFIIISVIFLIVPLASYVSALSGTPLILKYLPIHSLVIVPIGFVYIIIRKKLLKNYGKL